MTSAIRGLMATPKKNIQISKDGRLTHDITTTNTAACHEALTATIGAPELLPEVLVSLLTTPPAMEDGDNILQLEVDSPEEADSKANPNSNTLFRRIFTHGLCRKEVALTQRAVTAPRSLCPHTASSTPSSGCRTAPCRTPRPRSWWLISTRTTGSPATSCSA